MKPKKIEDKFKISFFLTGALLLFSLFFLQSGIRSVMVKMAEPVPGAHNFYVGEIQGGGKIPAARVIRVDVEPNTLYFMQAEVLGDPQIHMDLMSPGSDYDYAEQEMIILAGAKKGKYSLLFNSGITPSSKIQFRVFFLDDRPVSIKSIDLLRVPVWISRIGNSLVWLTAAVGLFSLLLGFTSNHVRVGLLILLISSFASYHITINPLEGDNRNYGMVAQTLLSDSNIILNKFSGRLEHNNFYGVVQDNGNFYNLFPLGPSIVLVPLYALVSIDQTLDASTVETLSGKLATALFFGGALSLFFFLASRFEGVGQSKALLLTFIFGFCSLQLSQHINMFWSHNAVMPFILAALLALKTARRDMIFLAGILLVLGYVMRPTAALLVPVVAAWLWFYRREAVGHFVAGCFVAGILVASMNLAFYGHLVSPYSQVGRLGFSSFFEALMGNLFSPNRGLFVFMPWALFSMWGIWLSFHNKIDPFFRLIVVGFFLHLILISSFPHWWAGWSYGPRFLVEVMPLLVLLLIPVFSSHFWNHKVVKPIFAATLVFSLLVQLGGLTKATNEWNALPLNVDQHPSRLWDWTDMQLLRPLNSGSASAKP